jgi:two-component sensor histidine kinase
MTRLFSPPGLLFSPVKTSDIEIDRTTLKADLVYNIQYRGQPHILNMELQTGSDNAMAIRMLQYHVGLHGKYSRPVISMVIYPFETSIPGSPYRETSGEEELLSFHYRILPLWKLDARQFVRDHVVCMYMLLPAMQGADAPMLVQAIQEMKDRYKEPQLGHHLIRFRTILRRSKTISEEDKQEVEDKLHTYDSLLDQDPYIQEQKALERTLGRTEGRVESIKTFQDTIVEIVKIRFPTLTELAQKKVMQLQNLADLKQLVVQLSISSDQVAAQQLLMSIG